MIKRKSMSFVEVLVYLFIFIVVWIYIFYLTTKFLEWINNKRRLSEFSVNYNNFIKDIYSDGYQWWQLNSFVISWVVLTDWTEYKWYKCLPQAIVITSKSTSSATIDWDWYYDKYYTWVNCADMTGNIVAWWYWINMDLSVYYSWSIDLKYFIKTP